MTIIADKCPTLLEWERSSDRDGALKLRTHIQLPAPFDKYTLRIATMKGAAGFIITMVTGHKTDARTDGVRWETHRLYTDFSERILSERVTKVTAKRIEAQHTQARAQAEEIFAKAVTHYQQLPPEKV